ncbi:alpha/beta hydrolase [Effusibacillus dendaii]|uniref:Acetylhydrolase n=1 Tax=Effusibacillus dendaii TaxID=2743772 RepID=A0A7I8D7V1_9BACL|nr:alpha/beta hydrolase [Effusibacillus dendaii]BCJ85462.1 acetylhydrolase [Effusibacillus dendaii]
MPLDPQAKAVLELMKSAGAPPLNELSPERARQVYVAMRETGEAEPVGNVENRTIPGPHGPIPIRIYTPDQEGPYPVLVYFHGGGWVIGNLDSHDPICRSLTNLAGCMVISVDYRLAPEHKFPVALEECYVATRWVFEHTDELGADPARIAVGGDSAGGNLAAVVSCQLRDRNEFQPICQVLFYPVTNFDFDTESYQRNGQGYYLTKNLMTWFRDHYLQNEQDSRNPLAAPLLTEDLGGLPSALVITAEFDPLCDEGEAYAKRLKNAGVPVEYTRYNGMIHGFISMANRLDQGKKALQQAAEYLKSVFAS